MAPKSRDSKQQAWGRVFDALPILADVAKQGFADVSADDMKKYGGYEPRLMAKMDFRENRPDIMVEHGLAILAIRNGLYRMGPFDPFLALKEGPQATPIKMSIPQGIVSLNPRHLGQESAVLDAAKVSGILAHAFGEEVDLTIRGRSRSRPFDFQLSGVHFPIDGVQVEVDGGYEGPTSINLVEAKIGGRSNISLRQILYPHRIWETIVQGSVQQSKVVRSFICFYESPVLRLIPVIERQGVWTPDHGQEKCYLFEAEANLDLRAIPVQSSASPPIAKTPFPQADRFDTVLSMFSMAGNAAGPGLDMETLADGFDLVPRQIGYYISALKWLGLIEQGKGMVELTSFGQEVAYMSHAERVHTLATIIFREPLFHHVLHHPDKAVPDALFTRWGLNRSTQARRLNTVHAWIRYFKQQTKTE